MIQHCKRLLTKLIGTNERILVKLIIRIIPLLPRLRCLASGHHNCKNSRLHINTSGKWQKDYWFLIILDFIMVPEHLVFASMLLLLKAAPNIFFAESHRAFQVSLEYFLNTGKKMDRRNDFCIGRRTLEHLEIGAISWNHDPETWRLKLNWDQRIRLLGIVCVFAQMTKTMEDPFSQKLGQIN